MTALLILCFVPILSSRLLQTVIPINKPMPTSPAFISSQSQGESIKADLSIGPGSKNKESKGASGQQNAEPVFKKGQKKSLVYTNFSDPSNQVGDYTYVLTTKWDSYIKQMLYPPSSPHKPTQVIPEQANHTQVKPEQANHTQVKPNPVKNPDKDPSLNKPNVQEDKNKDTGKNQAPKIPSSPTVTIKPAAPAPSTSTNSTDSSDSHNSAGHTSNDNGKHQEKPDSTKQTQIEGNSISLVLLVLFVCLGLAYIGYKYNSDRGPFAEGGDLVEGASRDTGLQLEEQELHDDQGEDQSDQLCQKQ